jgi:hypothetical protein
MQDAAKVSFEPKEANIEDGKYDRFNARATRIECSR